MRENEKANVCMIICACLKELQIEVSEAQHDSDLLSLGLNSIKFVQLILLLEDAFSCLLPDDKLFLSEMRTVNNIYEVIVSVLSGNEGKNDHAVEANVEAN